MVAIFTGLGNGLERGSGATLGAAGLLGGSSLGRSGNQVFLNAATGNLVISAQDEFLVGQGPDASIAHTYNSLGDRSDENGDNWRQSTDRRVRGLVGTLNSALSKVNRVSADGTEITYAYKGGFYETSDGAGAHDRLVGVVVNGATTWTWTDGDTQITETYSQHGASGLWRIDAQTDPDGRSVTFTYAADHLTQIATSDGSTLTYTWSGNNITAITSAYTDLQTSQSKTLIRTRYGYDTLNRLSTVTVDLSPDDKSITDGATYFTTYLYEGSTTRVKSITQKDGSSLTLTYDGIGRVIVLSELSVAGLARNTQITYESGSTIILDPSNQKTMIVYDTVTDVLQSIIPPLASEGAAQQETSFLYLDPSHVLRITDALAQSTNAATEESQSVKFQYDGQGNLISRTGPTGATTWTYSADNARLTETSSGDDISGSGPHTTWYVYDSEYHLRYVIGALGEVREYRYVSDGQLKYVVGYPEQRYNVSGLSETTRPTLAQVDSWQSELTQESSVELAQYTWDARGNLIQSRAYGIANNDGSASTAEGYSTNHFVYDQAGRLLSRYADGRDADTFVYDGLGRLIATVNPASGTTQINFKDTTQQTIVTLASGLVQTSTYNLAGDLTAYSEGGTGLTTASSSYKYDSLGRLRVATDALTRSSYIVYDKAGRKTADVAADGTLVEYRYDLDNRVVSTIRYASLLSSETLATLSDPNIVLTIRDLWPDVDDTNADWAWQIYDNGGRLIQSVQGDGATTVFVYDASNNLVKATQYYNILSDAQLSTLRTTARTTVLAPTANAAKDIVSRSFYDKQGRLVGQMDGAGFITKIVYDAAGRKTQTIAYANATTYATRATGSFTALTSASVLTVDATRDRTTRYVYDGQGLLRYVVDGANHVVQYDYDHADASTATIAYNGVIGSTADYTYDNIEELVSSAGLADDLATRRTWTVRNTLGQIAYTINAEKLITAYTYDAAGRIIKMVAYATESTQANLPSITTMNTWAASSASALDRTTRTYYNALGQVVYSVDAEGFVTENIYDLAGQIVGSYRYETAITATDMTTITNISNNPNTKHESPNSPRSPSALTRLQYDVQGRVSDKFESVDGETLTEIHTHYIYAGDGTLTSVTNAEDTNGRVVTIYTYDHAGRIKSETTAGAVTRYDYDGFGNVITVTDPLSHITTMTYDIVGNLVSTRNALNGVIYYGYTAFGDVALTTDERGFKTYNYYDKLGRLSKSVDALLHGTTTVYDSFGDILSVTRYDTPLSAEPTTSATPNFAPVASNDATTRFTYDRLGRVTNVLDAEGYSETYGLNAFGDRTTVTNKLGGVTTNTFDNRGLLEVETLMTMQSVNTTGSVVATSTTNKFYYDARGNRTKMIEAWGRPEARTTLYTYDELDRLTRTEGDAVADGTGGTTGVPAQNFTYDARGNLIQSEDALLYDTYYYYDALDRKVAEIDPLGRLSMWEYDAAGNVTSNAVYETLNPRSSHGGTPVGSGYARVTTYAYDALNRLTDTTVAGVRTGELAGSSYGTGVGSVTTHLEYDAAGNVIRSTDGNGARIYSYYDAMGRKTDQVDAARYLTHWTYDGDGNVLTETRYATVISDTYDTTSPPGGTPDAANDRLTTFTYDQNGRRRTETRATGYWSINSAGVLTETLADTATIYYDYNELGQVKSKKEATGDIVTYAYDDYGRLTDEFRPAYTADGYSGEALTPHLQYSYDGIGNLTRTRQGDLVGAGSDRITRYYYDHGRLTSTIDAMGATRNYYYDLAGQKVGESYARGTSGSAAPDAANEGITYRYDKGGHLTRQGYANVSGTTWTSVGDHSQMTYNAYGEVTARGVNAGSGELLQETFDYDNAGHLWRSNAGDGVWRFYVYDAVGNRTATIESEGRDLTGRTLEQVITIATPDGAAIGASWVDGINVTISVYDGRGQSVRDQQMQREANTSGTRTTLTTYRYYDAFGEATRVIAPAQGNTDYAYDQRGRVTSVTRTNLNGVDIDTRGANGAVVTGALTQTYRYDRSGRLIAEMSDDEIDANGNVVTRLTKRVLLKGTGYGDSEALVAREFHADGGVAYNKFDVFGDQRTAIDAVGRTTSMGYDRLGHLVEVAHAGGLVDTYGYDALGQRVTHSNSVLVGAGSVETTDYDIQGRITKQVAFGGDVTQTFYIWNGATATVGLGTYGAWTATILYQNGKTSAEASDIFGHVVSRTDLGGHVDASRYDRAGRLVSVTGPESRSYEYYNTGLVSVARTYDGGLTGTQTREAAYTYDGAGRKKTETGKAYEAGVWITTENAAASYNVLGRMTAWNESGAALAGTTVSTVPAAHVDWTYDKAGNIRSEVSTYRLLDGYGTASGVATTAATWYLYDAMNRMTRQGVLSGTQIVRGGVGGIDIFYDDAGQRAYTDRTEGLVAEYYGPLDGDYTSVNYDGTVREYYDYDAGGNLVRLLRAQSNRTRSGVITAPAAHDAAIAQADYTYDDLGRLTYQMDWEDGHVAFNRSGDAAHGYRVTYDNASRIVHELDLTLRQEDNVAVRTITTNNYGSGASYALGTLVSSTVHSETDFGTVSDTTTTNTIAWYEGAVTTRTRIVTDYANATPDTDFATDYGYSAGGTLTTATITDARPRTVAFRSDVLGQVIRRDETDGNAATGDPHALWYGYDGRRIGTVGNDGSSDVGYGDSIDARQFQPNTTKPQGAFQNGASSGIGYARFGQGYDTVTSFAQGAGGGLYTANAGDTLSSIALQVWGDAALWYKLAQANGLSEDASLAEGRTLTIPGGVLRSGNSASTFKPYDPSERMGDTSPTTPKPQAAAAHKKGCGVFGAIILIAIAVAVTVVTAGAAAAAAAPGLTLGQGITVALGGSAVLGGATVSATAIGLASFGAIGAVAGSIVSQGIGVATGLQDKFSWKSVALAALSGGVGGGLGAAFKGGIAGSQFLGDVARGAAGSAITQGISTVTGLQSKFDWAGVAVGGVVGGVVGGLSQALKVNWHGGFDVGNMARQAITGAAGAIAGGAARSLLTGSSFGDNVLAALPDVIGATIGNAVAGEAGVRGGTARPSATPTVSAAGSGGGDITVTAPSYQFGFAQDAFASRIGMAAISFRGGKPHVDGGIGDYLSPSANFGEGWGDAVVGAATKLSDWIGSTIDSWGDGDGHGEASDIFVLGRRLWDAGSDVFSRVVTGAVNSGTTWNGGGFTGGGGGGGFSGGGYTGNEYWGSGRSSATRSTFRRELDDGLSSLAQIPHDIGTLANGLAHGRIGWAMGGLPPTLGGGSQTALSVFARVSALRGVGAVAAERAPLFSSAGGELAGVERASQPLLDAVGGKRAVTWATPGSDAERFLNMRGAEAAAFGPEDILLRPNPSKAAVLEEFLHGTQQRLGVVDRLGTSGMGSAETHVKDFMVRHQNMLGLSAEDVRRIQMLKDMGL